jgi:ankyrin repeat protein
MADLGRQLWVASSDEDPAEAARLLDAGANKEWRGPYGATPIIEAAFWGKLTTLKLLADRGADVNARALTNASALMISCVYNNQPEVAFFLLNRGADIHARDWSGRHPESRQ